MFADDDIATVGIRAVYMRIYVVVSWEKCHDVGLLFIHSVY